MEDKLFPEMLIVRISGCIYSAVNGVNTTFPGNLQPMGWIWSTVLFYLARGCGALVPVALPMPVRREVVAVVVSPHCGEKWWQQQPGPSTQPPASDLNWVACSLKRLMTFDINSSKWASLGSGDTAAHSSPLLAITVLHQLLRQLFLLRGHNCLIAQLKLSSLLTWDLIPL